MLSETPRVLSGRPRSLVDGGPSGEASGHEHAVAAAPRIRRPVRVRPAARDLLDPRLQRPRPLGEVRRQDGDPRRRPQRRRLLRHHRRLPDSGWDRDPGIGNKYIPTIYADTGHIWYNYNTSLSDHNKNTADKNNRLSHRNPDRQQRQPRRCNHNADTDPRGNREDSNPNRHRHLHRRDRCLIWSSSPPTT